MIRILPTAKGRQYFHLLNALRGIAAILVVGRHTYAFGPVTFPVSGMAVDVFFLLSGVVIEANYQNRMESGLTPTSFIWLRIARIYPLYILGSAITLLTVCLVPGHVVMLGGNIYQIDHIALRWVLAMLCLPGSFRAPGMFVFNHPAWSLFFELVVNAFYAFIAVHLTSRRLGGMVCLCAIGLIGNLIYFHSEHLVEFGFEGAKTYFAGFCRTGFSFFFGMALCRISRMVDLGLVRRNSSVASLAIIGLTAALLMAPVSLAEQPYDYVFSVFIAFPALIFAALAVQPRRVLARACDFLGEISYPIYALHVPLFCVFSSIVVLEFGWQWFERWRLMAIAYGVPLLVLSYVVDKTYDRWARSLLRNLHRPATAAVTVGRASD